jgi:protein TonB
MRRGDDWKAQYGKCFYIGLLLAGLAHLAAFAFWPEYTPAVYRLTEVTVPWLVDVEPEIELPKPPEEARRPDVPVEIAGAVDADPDETMPPTSIAIRDLLRLPAVPPPVVERFVPLDRLPRLVSSVLPEYPDLARRAGVEGCVFVLVTIDEAGRVIGAVVTRTDAEILNKAAIEAAYKFIFEPGMQRDMPVKSRIEIPFRFVLED